MRAAIKAVDARRLFPLRSTHFNTTKMAFSKLKDPPRKAAERAVEGLWSTIGHLVDTVTPDEDLQFSVPAGYEPNRRETLFC